MSSLQSVPEISGILNPALWLVRRFETIGKNSSRNKVPLQSHLATSPCYGQELDFWESLKVELLLFQIKRSQLRGLGFFTKMSPGWVDWAPNRAGPKSNEYAHRCMVALMKDSTAKQVFVLFQLLDLKTKSCNYGCRTCSFIPVMNDEPELTFPHSSDVCLTHEFTTK